MQTDDRSMMTKRWFIVGEMRRTAAVSCDVITSTIVTVMDDYVRVHVDNRN